MKGFDVNGIIQDVVDSALGGLHLDEMLAGTNAGEFDPEGQSPPIEKEIPVGLQPHLTISDVHAGDVTVEGIDERVIRIRATRYGTFKTVPGEPFELEQDGSTVLLRARGRFHGTPVDYHLQVPRDCSVRLKSMNADLVLRHIQAAIEVESIAADVLVEDAAGSCSIRTVSGDAILRRTTGPLTWHTTSGDLQALECRLERFGLHSVSGDFIIESGLNPAGQYLVGTTSGDLRLRVPSDSGLTVQFKTFSGDVNTALPTEVLKSSKRTWQGRVNGGGAILEMASMSGDLQIETSTAVPRPQGPATASEREPIPQAEPPAPDDTNDILASLERGEISVDEAMARLDGTP